MTDNNREKMTQVTFVNISFKAYVIIHTEGLVTIQGCTLHHPIMFRIQQDPHENNFTYKTAEMIPFIIGEKMINFINTSVHYLHINLQSGIRTVNFINCDFVDRKVHFFAGDKSIEKEYSHNLTVLNITITNMIFRDSQLSVRSYGRESVISLKVINSSFNHSIIKQQTGAGYFGAVIEDSRFYESSFSLFEATSVSVRNCEYHVIDTFVDNIKIVGNIYVTTEPYISQNAIKLLIHPTSHIQNHFSTVYFENTMFNGNLNNQTNSVTKINEANLIMRNITFNIYQKSVNRKRWYIAHTSIWNGIIVELINVTINARSMPEASSIAMISTERFHLENLEIFCPMGLVVINISNTYEEQISCEQQCSEDGYTFQTGSAVINGNKAYHLSQYNVTYRRSKVQCKVCPLGANCTGSIKALTNYWGYRDFKDNSVTMIRCPDGYCCKGNHTDDHIKSCSAKRTGNICGKCKKGFSEALFSTECLSIEKCKGVIILLYYAICITIYILFLAMYKDLQNIFTQWIKKLYKGIKDKLCSQTNFNSSGLNQKHDSNIDINMGKVEEVHSNMKTKIGKIDKMSKDEDLHVQNIVPDKADGNTKYMQILFFYIQDTILFKVSIPGIENQEKGLIAKFLSFSPEIFTIIYTEAIHICFSHAKAPASKVLFNMFFGIYFVMIIWLLYLIQKLTAKFLKKSSNIWSKLKSSLLKAFLLGMLFSYQNLVLGAFTLVKCVDFANIKVLHIQGDIKCYNW